MRETERVCVRVVIIDVTYTSVGVPFTIVADPEYIAKSSYLEKVINVLALRLESCSGWWCIQVKGLHRILHAALSVHLNENISRTPWSTPRGAPSGEQPLVECQYTRA